MNWTEWTIAISSLASALAAVLAWAAKLRWSKEYGAAKDETIKAKEAQITGITAQNEEITKAKDAQIIAITAWNEEVAKAKDAQLLALTTQNEQIIKAKDAQIESLKSQIEFLEQFSPMKIREYFTTMQTMLTEHNNLLKEQLEEKNAQIKDLELAGTFTKSELETLKAEQEALNLEIQNSHVSEDELLAIIPLAYLITLLELSSKHGGEEAQKLVAQVKEHIRSIMPTKHRHALDYILAYLIMEISKIIEPQITKSHATISKA